MSGFFAAAGRFAVRFRWAVIAAWVVATVLAKLYLPSLDSVAKGSNSDYLPPGSASQQAAQLAVPFQGPNQAAIPVLVARDSIAHDTGALTAADRAAVGRLASGLGGVANVQKVKDLGVSRDGRAEELQVLATLDLTTQGPTEDLVGALRAAIRSAALPGELTAHLAGPLASQADAAQSSQRAGNVGEDLSILFILVLLLGVFRSVLAPLLTLAPAVLVTQLAGPVIGVAGKAGLQVSSLTAILLIVLALGAGTDYGLFLVFRVREELRDGLPPREAVVRALARVGESITFSAATVMAALLTLTLATLGLYSSLGAPLAIAVALMLLAGLTLMPALLAVFGRAAFWPSKTTPAVRRPGWWGRTAGRIVRRPAATLAVGLLGFGALAIAAIGYNPAGFGSGPPAPAGSDSAAGNALLAAHFPAANGNPTGVLLRFPGSVWTDPAPAAQAQRLLTASPQFNSVVGPFNSGQVPVTGSPFISPDGRTVQFNVSLTAGDPGSNAAMHAVPAVRAAVATIAREVGADANGVSGQAPSTYDVSQASDNDLLRIFPVAIIAIAILLALVLRSLIAPLYLIASVALSYLAAFGLSVLLFQDANGVGGLPYFVPFLMFLFLLALGEDYNILVMARIREEAGDIPLRQAVPHALERTGSTVSSAGLVLAGTFGVFAFVENSQPGGGVYRDILASLAIGILMDAFLVRTLLVPSTVALLGRWNWWPSSHGRPVEADPGPSPKSAPSTDLQLRN